jgi:hypothetical protein
LLQVPIEIQGAGVAVRSHTVVVNRQGAMVLSPRAFHEDELVRLLNLNSAARTLGRVVWCGGEDLPGLFKLGLEILGGLPHFWGEEYESALAKPAQPSLAAAYLAKEAS